MLVNDSAIGTSVLHSTLLEEIRRLQQRYSDHRIQNLHGSVLQLSAINQANQRQQVQKSLTKNQKNDRYQRKQHQQQQVLWSMTEQYRILKDSLSQLKGTNKQLISQLSRTRTDLRTQQHKLKLEEQQNLQLKTEYQLFNQRSNSKTLKQEDVRDENSKLYEEISRLREQKQSIKQNKQDIRNKLSIEEDAKRHVIQEESHINQEVSSRREQVRVGSNQLNSSISLTQKLIKDQLQQKYLLTIQTNNQKTRVKNLQIQLANTQGNLTNKKEQADRANRSYNQFEKKVESLMTLNQQISTDIFQTKVTTTNLSTSNSQIKQKISLLKKYKQDMIELATLY